MSNSRRQFDLSDRVAVITGGAGMLGQRHAEAILEWNGTAVLLDISAGVQAAAKRLSGSSLGIRTDITNEAQVRSALAKVLKRFGHVDILINNAANDPKVGAAGMAGREATRLEHFSRQAWDRDLAVGLTGAFLCSRVFGAEMARRGSGVILNIASDLSLIAPDQRLYRKAGRSRDRQPVKPVSYSVVKTGLIGLTRYLATYWADRGVRANALSPGGVQTDQPGEFVRRVSDLIPLGRMATPDEYKAAVVFLVSDASAYLNGANVVMDGGRSAW